MASLREYYDADFNYATKVQIRVCADTADLEVELLYDFAARTTFVSCYVPGRQRQLKDFLHLVEALQPGVSQVSLQGNVTLPSAPVFPGELQIANTNPFILRARFHGDPEWISIDDMPASARLFIYSETQLSPSEVLDVKRRGVELGQHVQFSIHRPV
jgi:hypothetical protein